MAKSLIMKEREFTSFVDGEARKFKITKPNFNQGNKADLIYKKAFTDALKEGIPTQAQIKEFGNSEFFDKISRIASEIDVSLADLTSKLESTTDEKEGMMLVLKLKEARARRFIESMKINAIYENTAETYAESIRNQYYISELLLDSNGKKVYSSFEDFKNRQTDQLAQDALLNVMMFIAQISDNYQMEFPENTWLLNKGIINEDGIVVKKTEIDTENLGNTEDNVVV